MRPLNYSPSKACMPLLTAVLLGFASWSHAFEQCVLDDVNSEAFQSLKSTIAEAMEEVNSSAVGKVKKSELRSLKGQRTYAWARFHPDGEPPTVYQAVSGNDGNVQYSARFAPYVANEQRSLKAVEVATETSNGRGILKDVDAEAKILESLYSRTTPTTSGTLDVASSLDVCDSCRQVFQAFEAERPNIKVRVLEVHKGSTAGETLRDFSRGYKPGSGI